MNNTYNTNTVVGNCVENASLLDYSKFSILESIPDETMMVLQHNLMLVRDLMVYKNPSGVEEWTPQDMIRREISFKHKTIFET